MRTRSFVLLVVAAAVPSLARAQSHGSFGVGVVRNEAFAPGSQLYGAALTFGGSMSLRLSGAVLPERREGGLADTVSLRGWMADADLVLSLSHNRWSDHGGLSIHPYAFIGVGEMRMRDRYSDITDKWNSWSYGGGAAVPVMSWFAVTGDARYRRAWERESAAYSLRDFPRGWEYRLGVAVGGGR